MENRIFLIDDLSISLGWLNHHLEQAGIREIELFECPLKALERMRIAPPSIIITDYQMPGMSGVELLQKVEFHFGKIPSLIATSDPDAAASTPHDYPILKKGVPEFFSQCLNFIRNIQSDFLQQAVRLLNCNRAIRLNMHDLAPVPVYRDSVTCTIFKN